MLLALRGIIGPTSLARSGVQGKLSAAVAVTEFVGV